MNFRFFVVIAIFSFILSCDKKVKPLQLNTSWSYSGYFEDENSKKNINGTTTLVDIKKIDNYEIFIFESFPLSYVGKTNNELPNYWLIKKKNLYYLLPAMYENINKRIIDEVLTNEIPFYKENLILNEKIVDMKNNYENSNYSFQCIKIIDDNFTVKLITNPDDMTYIINEKTFFKKINYNHHGSIDKYEIKFDLK